MTNYDDKTIDEVLEMDKLEYVENNNPLRPEELKDPHRVIKIELLGIIAAYQEPVCCNRIFRDYEEMNGSVLEPRDHGFKNFTSMMRTFSDKFNCHQDGIKTTYTAKTTERSGHLQELIKNQTSVAERRAREMKRSRSHSRHGRMSSYGAGIYYSQKFVPLLTDDRTEEERIADNLSAFGRSLAAAEAERRGRGLNWGGMRSGNVETSSDEDDASGMIVRSKSVPPPSRTAIVFDDPRSTTDDLDDCTNPFRVKNNVRIRDLVIRDGEADEDGRKGLALVELVITFRKEHRLPLGGIPNLTEERLMTKMTAVETPEWTVERLGDGNAYVIVPVETVKKAAEVGPGMPSVPREPRSAEKPNNSRVSPEAKRMLGFALKGAISNNNRMGGTRERALQERLNASEMQYGEILADSDGDPVMSYEPVVEQEEQQLPPTPRSFDREAMLALSDNDVLEPSVERLASSLKILRSQSSPSRSSGSQSSPPRGNFAPGWARGPTSQPTPPEHQSSMWSSQPSSAPKPSAGFGGGVPSFGTFRSAPQPASLAPADKDNGLEDDYSKVLQPSESNLASKLPQMAFSAMKAPATGIPGFGGLAVPSFGTSSQSVPAAPTPTPAPRATSVLPTFGGAAAASSSSSSSAFQSAFAGVKPSSPPSSKPVAECEKKGGAELLGATIQLIGRLQSGAVVYMRDIERTPVEDVVAGNPDFFDIDEKDERIHLLHKDVDPLLLMHDGRQLGEVAGEEKKQKVEAPPSEARAGAFSRPSLPTFGGAAAQTAPPSLPTFGGRPLPTFSRPSTDSATRVLPTFGGAAPARKMVEVVEQEKQSQTDIHCRSTVSQPRPESVSFGARPEQTFVRPPSTMSAAPVKPRDGMPSFGTKSTELQRPESALSNRVEEESKKVRELPTFGGVAAPRPPPVQQLQQAADTSDSSDDEGTQESKYNTAASGFSSRNGASTLSLSYSSITSIHSYQETLDAEGREDAVVDVVTEAVQPTGPYVFPNHKDIISLGKKPALAFDSVLKGHIHLGAVLTSFAPNRLLLTLSEENMMEKLQMIMKELGSAYGDVSPLNDAVRLGQFAVAINGDVIVRVVVLRAVPDEPNSFECACLDFNAVINVEASALYPLIERFGVHTLRALTFLATLTGVPNLGEAGHRAVRMVVKGMEGDESVKKPQPFVFHGKDELTGDLRVDVAIMMGSECTWMGEAFPHITGSTRAIGAPINPNAHHARVYAQKQGLVDYFVKEEQQQMQQPEERKEQPLAENNKHMEEKEEGELDSSRDETTSSDRTLVDKHAAGDFVREVKEEEEHDEFVFVAPAGPKPVLDVESMTSIIRKLSAKGEHVEVEVLKSMCRALVLTVNKCLSNLGERGALIANAEALEAIQE